MNAQPKPVLAAVPATPTWRDADAEALETRADNIQAALLALERLDGMFQDREELATHTTNTVNLLRVEEDNLRTRAQRVRQAA